MHNASLATESRLQNRGRRVEQPYSSTSSYLVRDTTKAEMDIWNLLEAAAIYRNQTFELSK